MRRHLRIGWLLLDDWIASGRESGEVEMAQRTIEAGAVGMTPVAGWSATPGAVSRGAMPCYTLAASQVAAVRLRRRALREPARRFVEESPDTTEQDAG
jgi:hypothetical protein